ncbi:protein translocase subunit SecD [Anaerosacchariphilus polymeriproducens]|uniref:Multifunctional fusion protein n=1 Tax=Anaerosacchariphilus polymeriproducens TaxID=1812858 RepID=A0A371AWN6_9FIRM|nr:protein translocase subunit SecD [Anaerosacchariphilus polymeriproducens]RDU24004.1 protein translocase subunit SecD [Anaerosacchariphilus polymeriproducens]
MKKNRGRLILALAAIVILFFGFVAIKGMGPTGTGAAKNIKLGLDLSGGVSITYQVEGVTPSQSDMDDTIYKLQKRVEGYSTESSVYQEGNNRINIEIPGKTDANAILEELGKPGSLEFQLEDGTVIMTGNQVDSATAGTANNNMGNSEYVVDLKLNKDGAAKFADVTSANLGKRIAIVYDKEVISAPTVESAITNGQCQITGMESFEAADNLASQIRIGSLSLELKELRSNVVGAQLGEQAVSTSVKAGIVGLALVAVFMCAVYLVPGFAASIALIIYTLLILITLNAFNITLTLPGIAGIVLSIGMAVDANVIIFARIREELASGKSVNSAIQSGFHKALSAILDGNITTLIAAFVLNIKGYGSVKGFAQTLAIGVVLSMFSALVITKLILNALYAIGLQDAKYYGVQKERKVINFLGKRKLSFALAALVIIGGFVTMGINSSQDKRELNYSLDFMGGTSTNVTFKEDYTIDEIDAKVIPVVEQVTKDGNVVPQKVAGGNQVIIKTRELNVKEREQLTELLVKNFKVDKNLITAESISSTVSSEMRYDALWAVLGATFCMLLYIWFRFKDIRFATSAVLALLIDVFVVFAFYAIARVPVGNTFVACMLTIVGYSINSTIVIFDRIRENIKTVKKNESLAELVNQCITQTLSRSIYTNLTTFITIAALFIMGVSSVREFASPLMVGIIGGAFSSIFITGALWYVMKTKFIKKTT